MPAWLIETFGSAQLNRVFWSLALMTAPAWLGMLLFPSRRWAARLFHPLFLPSLYALGVVYLYWETWQLGTPRLSSIEHSAARAFVAHPLVFLVLFAKVQVLNLFLGCALFREARSQGLRIPGELVLCWLLGPVGLLAFALRSLLARALKR